MKNINPIKVTLLHKKQNIKYSELKALNLLVPGLPYPLYISIFGTICITKKEIFPVVFSQLSIFLCNGFFVFPLIWVLNFCQKCYIFYSVLSHFSMVENIHFIKLDIFVFNLFVPLQKHSLMFVQISDLHCKRVFAFCYSVVS